MNTIASRVIEQRHVERQISPTARRRIEAQGFIGYSDGYLADINYWLRLAPFICMIWVAVGTWMASPYALWALAPFALLGAVLSGHPFDVIYNRGIRHLIGTPALPKYGKPRRFGCGVMTVWLGIEGAAFYGGWVGTGYALGIFAVLMSLTNVTTGFCVPSFTYGRLFGKPQALRSACSE